MRPDEALSQRLLSFAVRTVRMTDALPKTQAGRTTALQVLRSATSAGANYEEARGAESHNDFRHKLGITLKELKETRFWLRLAAEVPLIRPPSKLDSLLAEVEELAAIVGKSVSTAKKSAHANR